LLCEPSDILDMTNPEEIFVSSIIDTHPGYRVLAELGRELAQARRNRLPVLHEHSIWFWDPWTWQLGQLLELRTRILGMEEFRMRKREAIAAYRSQVTNLT
jgi:LmbE family N-acetylglucosaminyl deacetylase